MTNFFSQFVSQFLTSLIGVVFMFTGMKSGTTGQETKTPGDFTPVLRFIVCSDIHLNGKENQEAAVRMKNLFADMYAYGENSDYKNLDAFLVAGDFTGGGRENEYRMFNKIIEENMKSSTQLITVLGNHEFIEYRDVDATVGYDVYKKFINENVDTHVVINGYHFIGVSYDDDGKSFTKKMVWLDQELAKATKDDPSKPVYVINHPHPTLTVYGSVNWSDMSLRTVLNKYPQVVDFSGHSHYAPSDPRSVWQGEFTAVGCGSLSAFMGNLNYIEGDKDAPGKSGGAWLVECDADGNVSMKLYDIENRMFFGNIDYYFTNLSNSSKRTYNWHKQKSLDTAPLFPENAVISGTKENDEVVISFPEARGYYEAENYKIKVTDSKNKTVFEQTVISEYVRATDDDVRVSLGNLSAGEYTVKVDSYSPYAMHGQQLKNTITVE
ncbi:MAG: metallophosphoesterase [Clostridia bacterium]|nr:metallophosphoesterase [Clostridia bacterium]